MKVLERTFMLNRQLLSLTFHITQVLQSYVFQSRQLLSLPNFKLSYGLDFLETDGT